MTEANVRGQGHRAARPRVLLLPGYSKLEWVIRPQLERWAEVAAFDAPGVGDESPPGGYDTTALAERAAAEVDRLGWQACFVAADEFAIAAALKFAARHRDAVQGLALGHACLTFSPDADPPAINAEVGSAFTQVAELDDRTFMRHLTQITQGFYGEELADRMLERIPTGVAQAYARESMADPGDWIEGVLRDLGKPLLLAEHDPCLLFTRAGYEAAVSAFPDSMQVTCEAKPTVSPAFAEALREFCQEVVS
jgi:pimeloyl-ACP methyl ester carboxylesterase